MKKKGETYTQGRQSSFAISSPFIKLKSEASRVRKQASTKIHCLDEAHLGPKDSSRLKIKR